MHHPGRRLTTAILLAALLGAATACDGGDGQSGPLGSRSTPAATGSHASAGSMATRPIYAACNAQQRAEIPKQLSATHCWSMPSPLPDDQVLVGGQLWSRNGTTLTVSDAATGAQVTVARLRGDPTSMAVVQNGDTQQVLVVGTQTTTPTATTQAHTAWIADGYTAPATAASSIRPAYAVAGSVPYDESGDTTVLFGRTAVFTGNAALNYGASSFTRFTAPDGLYLDGAPRDAGKGTDYDPVGLVSGQLVGYVRDDGFDRKLALHDYIGFVSLDATGKVVWDKTTDLGEHSVESPSSANLTCALVGDYIVAFSSPKDTGGPTQVFWYDAATGKPATPTAQDLAGKTVVGSDPEYTGTIVVSPDGKYVVAKDVFDDTPVAIAAAGSSTVTRVASEQELTPTVIVDGTAFARSDGGTAAIDLATGKAVALPSATGAPSLLTDDAVLVDDGAEGGELLVAR